MLLTNWQSTSNLLKPIELVMSLKYPLPLFPYTSTTPRSLTEKISRSLSLSKSIAIAQIELEISDTGNLSSDSLR